MRRPPPAGLDRLLARCRAGQRPARAGGRVDRTLGKPEYDERADAPQRCEREVARRLRLGARTVRARLGIVEAGTSRDEAWRFFTLSRSLEQANMTARLFMTRSLTEASAPSWTTILRSCGAHESYLRTYPGVPADR